MLNMLTNGNMYLNQLWKEIMSRVSVVTHEVTGERCTYFVFKIMRF